jgi:hypothetical protein
MGATNVDEDSGEFLATDGTDGLLGELVLVVGADPLGVEEGDYAIPE